VQAGQSGANFAEVPNCSNTTIDLVLSYYAKSRTTKVVRRKSYYFRTRSKVALNFNILTFNALTFNAWKTGTLIVGALIFNTSTIGTLTFNALIVDLLIFNVLTINLSIFDAWIVNVLTINTLTINTSMINIFIFRVAAVPRPAPTTPLRVAYGQ